MNYILIFKLMADFLVDLKKWDAIKHYFHQQITENLVFSIHSIQNIFDFSTIYYRC